jgi:hypothetical protein
MLRRHNERKECSPYGVGVDRGIERRLNLRLERRLLVEAVNPRE